MKKNEKATLVIKLTRNQLNRSVRTCCELAGETEAYKISNDSWSKLIEEPIEVDIEDCLSIIPESDRKSVIAAMSIFAIESKFGSEDIEEDIDEEETLENAREILRTSIEILDKKLGKTKKGN